MVWTTEMGMLLKVIPQTGLPVGFYLRKKETGHAGGRAMLCWARIWLCWARWAGLGVGFGSGGRAGAFHGLSVAKRAKKQGCCECYLVYLIYLHCLGVYAGIILIRESESCTYRKRHWGTHCFQNGYLVDNMLRQNWLKLLHFNLHHKVVDSFVTLFQFSADVKKGSMRSTPKSANWGQFGCFWWWTHVHTWVPSTALLKISRNPFFSIIVANYGHSDIKKQWEIWNWMKAHRKSIMDWWAGCCWGTKSFLEWAACLVSSSKLGDYEGLQVDMWQDDPRNVFWYNSKEWFENRQKIFEKVLVRTCFILIRRLHTYCITVL